MGWADIGLKIASKFKPSTLADFSESIGEGAMNLAKKVPGAARDFVDGENTFQFLKQEEPETVGFFSKVMQTVHSSDYLMNKYSGGKKVVQDFTEADIAYRNFLDAHAKKVEKFRGLATESRQNVFRALEDRLPEESLSTDEKPAFTALKNQYDFFGKRYTEFLAKGTDNYNMVVKLHQSGAAPEDVPDTLKEAFEFYSRLRKNYAPHIFDKDEYLDHAQKRVTQLYSEAQSTKNSSKIEFLNKQISQYENNIKMMESGHPLAYESLPKDYIFRHQLERKGVEGFGEDAIKSYDTYVSSMARKMYINPAVQRAVTTYYNELPVDIRPYAKWFIRDFAGYNGKTVFNDIAGAVANFEYVRTLGFNLRSPIANLTQQFNTIADVGPKWAMKGYLKAFTQEGKDLWERSGLHVEAPTSLTEELSPTAGKIEKLQRVFGWFFNQAENANRRHALNSYYLRARSGGLSEEDALRDAIQGVHRTQFIYGKVGMPKILRSPAGRVGLQYSSFTIKQAEFLWNMLKQNPAKVAGWAGMNLGANYTLANVFGIDLSNALGFGVNFGEALDMAKSASQGEMEEAWEHLKLTFAQGSGILPSGPGPAVTGAKAIYDALSKGEKVGETAYRELTPIATQRIQKILLGIEKRQEGQEGYPVVSGSGEYLYDTDPTHFFLGPMFRPQSEADKQARSNLASINEQVESKKKRHLAELIADGKMDKARSLAEKWKLMPSAAMISDHMLAKRLPREQRAKYMKREQKLRLKEIQDLEEKAEE